MEYNTWNDDRDSNGFRFVGSIDWKEADYEFYMNGVWEKGGRYYTAYDSGCSCPSPFEDTKVEDLIGPFTKSKLRFELTRLSHEKERDEKYGGHSQSVLKSNIDDLIARL